MANVGHTVIMVTHPPTYSVFTQKTLQTFTHSQW